MADYLSQIIFWLGITLITLGVIGAMRRVRLWRQGQSSTVHWMGLLQIPKRYLVDLHHVVARDKYISNTHVATAGGFVLTSVLVIIVYLFGIKGAVLNWLMLFSSALMLVGAVFVFKRRINPPANLSKGKWSRLPYSLLIYSTTFLLLSLPATGLLPDYTGSYLMIALLSVGVFWGFSEMYFGITWGGPMKHAFAGALHLG